jgi:hypothetical protein
MLRFKLSKRNGGFVLWGDYNTLEPINSFLMDISEKSSILDDEGLIPALAYDLRKAYEGRREKDNAEVWNDNLTLYGVEQIWPLFITQIALLRTSLAFIDSGKKEQAIMYQLEAFVIMRC